MKTKKKLQLLSDLENNNTVCSCLPSQCLYYSEATKELNENRLNLHLNYVFTIVNLEHSILFTFFPAENMTQDVPSWQ